MDRVIRLTLDTNIFSKQYISLLEFLIDCQHKGILLLFVAPTVVEELVEIPEQTWREQALAMAKEACILPELREPELVDQVIAAVFPGISPENAKYAKRRKDALILAQHIASNKGYFITRDRHFLQHRDKLYVLFKCKIKTPNEIRNKL